MYPPSLSEVVTILVAALVLYFTGLFKAAGEATWKAIQSWIDGRKD